MKKIFIMVMISIVTTLFISHPGTAQPPSPTIVNMNFEHDGTFPSLTSYKDTTGLARFTGSAFRLTPEERDSVVQKIVELVREDFKDFNIVFNADGFTAGAYWWGIDDSFYVFYDEPSECTPGGWGRLYGKAGGNPSILPGPCSDPGVHPKYARTWAGSFAIIPRPDLDPNVISFPPLIPYSHCSDAERHPHTGFYCGHFLSGSQVVTVDGVAQALANSAAHEISHLFGTLHTGQIDPVTGNTVNANGQLLQSENEWTEANTNKSFDTVNYNILMRNLGTAPPELPKLISPTHSKGQPSCEQVLTVQWETPYAVRGVGGYSYTIVDQNDPFYDLKRRPDEIIDLNSSATSFTTPPLGSGLWEFNIVTIDTEGLPSRFYSSFWVDIASCSVKITRPRAGDIFQVGEVGDVFWDSAVTYGGNDVGAGYDVDSIDLFKGPVFIKTLQSNLPNIGANIFLVPNVKTGSDYNLRIILDRNSGGDMFPELPVRFIGFSDFFTIRAATIPGDLDGDNDVDQNDLNIVLSYRNQPASACSACDLDGDGMVTALDARKLVTKCTRPRCATQ